MKKSKQENLLSPSSWRETHNPPRRTSNSSAVSSGCLPGFFNLFLSTFNFSSNRRKSITLGSNKREQRTVVNSSSPDGGGTVKQPLPRNEGVEGDAARVSLVGALEKCDRDLEELRRTINVIKTSYLLHKKLEVSPTTARGGFKFCSTGDVVVGTQTDKNMKATTHETDTDTTMLSKAMKNDQDQYKDNTTYKVNHINLITRVPDHYAIHDVISRRTTMETRDAAPIMVKKIGQSLMESVNEVCDEVASGQQREVAKVCLAIHDHICRDLIAETVHELSYFFSNYGDDECRHKSRMGSVGRHIRRGSANSLPLDACRRRLVF
ncbi:hypothetical protein N665_1584s0008 [Sinapis alba]|nr:hypothetical protein N665_1584s0008 [Sinapis alba]